LYSLEETKEAIHLFESNFDENPSQSTRQLSQFRAGYIYLYDLEDPKASYEAFKKLRDKARSSAYAEYYEKKVNRDVSGFYGYEGFKLLKEGYKTLNPDKYTEALAQFDLALKITYDLDLAYCGKSLAYNLLERSDDSLKTAQMTKQLSSNSADTVTVLGYIYYSLGMNDKAISEYQAAAKLKPNLVIPQYNLGTLHLLKKDYRKAKKHLKLTIKADPSFAQAYNNLGYVYWLENNYKSARKNFRQAISLDPDLVEPKYNLGVVLVALGEYEKARKEFSEVEGLQSGYRRTAYYLNMIKKRLGY